MDIYSYLTYFIFFKFFPFAICFYGRKNFLPNLHTLLSLKDRSPYMSPPMSLPMSTYMSSYIRYCRSEIKVVTLQRISPREVRRLALINVKFCSDSRQIPL